MSNSILAVFGDIHSNLEALQAVCADMDLQRFEQRVCLGDIVGYAADPRQCLQFVRSLGCAVVQGNHDAATAEDYAMDGMRDVAQRGIEFSRLKLSAEERAYLGTLPFEVSAGRCQFVHASLECPQEWRYIMLEQDAREHFAAQTHPVCFCGHTHVPGVWHSSSTGTLKSWRGEGRIQLPAGGKVLINAGSVGQPRDLCPDACYALFDAEAGWVEFRRVAYDVRKTRRKILRANLPRLTAERLSLGK
ncbi:MAG: metallophosphatase family protein [Verrucomicrobiota bacterium]|nr:metallophosphatase family protein [Verrucomicrobiota bacterium]